MSRNSNVPYSVVECIRQDYRMMKNMRERHIVKFLAREYDLPIDTIRDYVFNRTRLVGISGGSVASSMGNVRSVDDTKEEGEQV